MWSAGENPAVWRSLWRYSMLQWKPRLIVLLAVLALVAAAFGQFTWNAIDQLTW